MTITCNLIFSKGKKAFQSRTTSLLKFEILLIEMSSVFHKSTTTLKKKQKNTLTKDSFASKFIISIPPTPSHRRDSFCATQIVITGFDKITASLTEPHSLPSGP